MNEQALQEFETVLKAIAEETEERVRQLICYYRDSYADGELGDQPLPWNDAPSWDRIADRFVEVGGYIYDRVCGTNRTRKDSMTRRLRKALGYYVSS